MKKSIRSLFAFLVLIGVAIAGEMINVAPSESAQEFADKADALLAQINEQESGWDQDSVRQRQKIVNQLRVTLEADTAVQEIKEFEAKDWMNEGRMLTFNYQGRFVAVYVPFRDWSHGTAGLSSIVLFGAGKAAENEAEKKLVAMGPSLFSRECSHGAKDWLVANMKYGVRRMNLTPDIDFVVSQILSFSIGCTRLGEKG